MKYECIKEESREYKYGPGEEFTTSCEARSYVNYLKNQIHGELIADGFGRTLKQLKIVHLEQKNAFKLIAEIRYPKNIFEK